MEKNFKNYNVAKPSMSWYIHGHLIRCRDESAYRG